MWVQKDMEQPSIAELLELIMQAESSIDTQFQFWLTITFATIVASFMSKDLLTVMMRTLVVSLYLVATFVLASHWYYDAMDIGIYSEMLAAQGYINAFPIATGFSRVLLILLGTCATLFFVYASADRDK